MSSKLVGPTPYRFKATNLKTKFFDASGEYGGKRFGAQAHDLKLPLSGRSRRAEAARVSYKRPNGKAPGLSSGAFVVLAPSIGFSMLNKPFLS
jgi:hypothetical protein